MSNKRHRFNSEYMAELKAMAEDHPRCAQCDGQFAVGEDRAFIHMPDPASGLPALMIAVHQRCVWQAQRHIARQVAGVSFVFAGYTG
jgi:hypothetical protein